MYYIVQSQKITWVDIQNPVQKDIAFLKKNFDFHPLILKELIPPSHGPKIEYDKKYIFMTLYYPYYSKTVRETKPREINIIATKDAIITNHYQSILPFRVILDKCKVYPEAREAYISQGTGYLLFYIIDALWKNCLLKLLRIGEKLDAIEKEMFQGKEQEMVREISLVKMDIIDFWRAVEPQGRIMNSLANKGVEFFDNDLAPYFHDIAGTYEEAWQTLKTYKETIYALEETNQSLLSTKINEIMKVLTLFSVIFLPLTLIASIWGMNISLPLENHSAAFWILAFTMAALVFSMLSYFKKRNWL